MPRRDTTLSTLRPFLELGLVSVDECSAVGDLFAPEFPFSEALALAETLHVHVKVEDVRDLPRREILAAGGEVEYERRGSRSSASAAERTSSSPPSLSPRMSW
jgi:hypothetical protein